jgi:voltage-gated potassium channel
VLTESKRGLEIVQGVKPGTVSRVSPPNPGSDEVPYGRPLEGWRLRVYSVIFEAETRSGRLFDLLLVCVILVSVTVVMLDSVQSIREGRERLFDVLEWGFTLLFTVEYAARLWCVRKPLRYASSGFGIIDLLAILPTYLAFFFPALHLLIDVRVLRLLRIFRILKLGEYVAEFSQLGEALRASRRKILVFLSFVIMAVVVMGTLMYVVEGPHNGFTSVPASVYWAITTMTTVGFGDITPKTDLGRLIASLMMLLGWGTLAVPTGIVTAEITARRLHPAPPPPTTRTCEACLSQGHAMAAKYCCDCGAPMGEAQPTDS